jgi:hypothetical protein
MYRPVKLVGLFAIALFFVGLLLGGRFLYYYVKNPSYSGYTQSLVVATGAVIVAFLLLVTALLSELIASNRRLLEEVLLRVRRLELDEHHRVVPSVVSAHARSVTGDPPRPPETDEPSSSGE